MRELASSLPISRYTSNGKGFRLPTHQLAQSQLVLRFSLGNRDDPFMATEFLRANRG